MQVGTLVNAIEKTLSALKFGDFDKGLRTVIEDLKTSAYNNAFSQMGNGTLQERYVTVLEETAETWLDGYEYVSFNRAMNFLELQPFVPGLLEVAIPL